MSFTSAVLHSLEWDHAVRQRALVLVLRNLDREKKNEFIDEHICERMIARLIDGQRVVQVLTKY